MMPTVGDSHPNTAGTGAGNGESINVLILLVVKGLSGHLREFCIMNYNVV